MGGKMGVPRPTKYGRRRRLFGMSRFHTRLLRVAGIGWMFAAMDIGLISFVMPALSSNLKLLANQQSLVLALTFLGMFAGAALGGSFSDRLGRKGVFQFTMVLYALGTGLSAASWDFNSLVAFRFLAGLGLGGLLPVAATLVSEWSQPKTRGAMVVLLHGFWVFGWALAVGIGLWILPALPENNGWRVAFAIGALPSLYVFYLRRALPESPRYLASAGRAGEAVASLRTAGRAAGSFDAVPSIEAIHITGPPAERWYSLFSRSLAKRTGMLWLAWLGLGFSYYGVFTWLYSLQAESFDTVRGLQYNLLVTAAELPGYFLGAWLVELLGRRITLAGFLCGSALSTFLFRNAVSPEQVLTYGCLLSFFLLGAVSVLLAYTPEQYPMRIRGWGTGLALAVGSLGAIFGPLLTNSLAGANANSNPGGVNSFFISITVFFLLVAAAVFFLGEETKGRTLEEIAYSPTSPQTEEVTEIIEVDRNPNDIP